MNEPSAEEIDAQLAVRATFSGDKQAAELLASRSVEKSADALFQAIPEGAGEFPEGRSWKTIEIHDSGEPLEPIGPFSPRGRQLFTDSIYFGERNSSPYMTVDTRLDGAMTTIFVRAEEVEMLLEAQQLLPEHHYLIVMDSFRPLVVQQSLYDHYLGSLKELHPDWTDEQLSTETQNYVSLPAPAPDKPWVSPHNTGGSIDLAIIRLPEAVDERVKEIDGLMDSLADPDSDEGYELEMERIMLVRIYAEMLDFGTAFDHGTESAALRELESTDELSIEETEARDNRRMLYNAMVAAGFEPYAAEWWHFNSPKSQMGAATAGLDEAEYGQAELSIENMEFELMRRSHHDGMVRLQEELMGGEPVEMRRHPGEYGFERDLHYVELNRRVLRKIHDPRFTNIHRAEQIGA